MARTPERRRAAAPPPRIETRQSDEGVAAATIVGYAAVFYNGTPETEMRLDELELVERIAPGAFDRSLARGDDVVALLNHDENIILGRRAAGTLRLTSDAVGLRFEIDVPAAPSGQDIYEAVRRGDLRGASFAFYADAETFARGGEGEPDVRTITEATLLDVGPCTWPAYEGTSAEPAARAGGRSAGAVDADLAVRLAAWRAGMQARARRLRLLRVDDENNA